jgi:hypothetical protein
MRREYARPRQTAPSKASLHTQNVATVAVALEVDRPDQIDLVQLVGGPGLRARVFLTWQ